MPGSEREARLYCHRRVVYALEGMQVLFFMCVYDGPAMVSTG